VHKHSFASVILAFCLTGCATFQAATEIQSGRSALLSGQPAVAVASFERVSASDANYVHDSIPLRESVSTYLGRAYYDVGKLPEAHTALRKAVKQNDSDFMGRLYLGLTLLRQAELPVSKNSLSVQDIAYALKERVTPARVAALVKDRGVSFDLNDKTERELRILGADDDLLRQIRTTAEQKSATEQKLKREALGEIEKGLKGVRELFQQLAATPQGRFWDRSNKIRSQVEASLTLITSNKADGQDFIAGVEWLGQALEQEPDLARRDEQEELQRRQRR
jgi:tetratricopeptide (TPR) repeat protein